MAEMWMTVKASRAEAQLWLKANIVPVDKRSRQSARIEENKTTTDSTPEDPLKLIESVAVNEHADHIIALIQEQLVGFRVRDGA